MLSSFKHKLALYFLLLAVLPLAVAFWGFGTLAKRAEERRVDARLEAELRALSAVDTGRLGRLPMLRSDSKLASGDRIAFLPRSKTKTGSAYVSVSGTRYRALTTAPLAERPRVRLALLTPAHPIDAAAATTRRHLLYVLLGCLALLAAIVAAEGRSIMRSVRELAHAARAIGKGRLNERVPVRGRDEFATLAGSFNTMADQLRTRLLELELERTRLRSSLSRTGELLTATHDADQLLTVIASAALEAADAEGVVLISEQDVVVELGTITDHALRYELQIAAGESRFGSLVLYAGELRDDDLVAAGALVAQAAVALENARLHEVVELEAITDALTGLSNRRHCEEQLAAEMTRSERFATPLAVVLCDIDEFKAANDSHGHAFGDLVLRGFARALDRTLRDIDVCGRWGGEEFLIVLPGTTLEGAVEAAERIRSGFAALELAADDDPVRMTASFGVASFTRGTKLDELVRSADEALYAAKRSGKNRVRTARLSVASR